MNPKLFLMPAIAALIIAFFMPVQAQGLNISQMVTESEQLMSERRWEEALQILNEAAAAQGGDPEIHMIVFGPRFGLIHYRRGLCYIRLGQWDEAIEAFETCYRDFPNDPNRPQSVNRMRVLALLRWAEAAMGLNDWEQALDQFRKFEQEKGSNDRFNRGRFHTDVATCHYNLGNIADGNENLEIAINNKVEFDTPETAIIIAFQTLVKAAIKEGNEQVLVDFINKNRAGLSISPFRMEQYLEVFLRLAGDSFNADMPRAAIMLYQMVPPTRLVLEDARGVLEQLGGTRGLRAGGEILIDTEIQESISRLETLLEHPSSPETIKLAALAFIHENVGNLRGAFTAYRLLEQNHPNSARREDYLYNLVRTSSLLGEPEITAAESRKFIETFPDSAYVPTVRRLMLASLFFNENYSACIQIATEMLPTLEEGTDEHDMCLHVLGGSYFYTGRYDEAKPLLDQHVETYPESEFLLSARYFQASNEVRLQFWQRAARLLDQFIEDFPDPADNSYYPIALFDRVRVHYAEEQNDAALTIINRILSEFPDSQVVDQALIQKGNIHQSEGELEKAYEAYQMALEIAESRRNHDIAGDAIYFMANVSAERITEDENDPFAVKSVGYAERFWDEFATGSPFKTQMAVVQMEPLGNLGRFSEGLERLQSVISEMARTPDAFGLEEAINSYTDAYLQEHTIEELREHYYNFPGVRVQDRAARALLRIAVIGAYEDYAERTDDPDDRIVAQGTVRALFQELKSDFNPAELTNFILVKLGDYLRNNTSAPREALAYYNEVLERTDQSYRFEALAGRADILGSSDDPQDQARAVEDFERIFQDSQDRSQREFALFRIVGIHLDTGNYERVIERARLYLDREQHSFNQYRGRVSLMIAKAFERSDRINDAIARYNRIWTGPYTGEIRVSAPAVKRWMELMWEKNRPASGDSPSDRQGAYHGGLRYIELTERLKRNMTSSELADWEAVEALVRQYEAHPSIEPAR